MPGSLLIRMMGACCRRASTTASTAQHSTAQRIHPAQSSEARADQSAATEASRQSWREPACRREFTARCVLKTMEKIVICPAYSTRRKKTRTHTQVINCAHYNLLPELHLTKIHNDYQGNDLRPFNFVRHVVSGMFSRSMELFFVRLHRKAWTLFLLCLLHSIAFWSIFPS